MSAILRAEGLTSFETRVYETVARIPSGEVRTYKWVAAEIGRPRAFRAVGNALNKNPHPGMIPCHRVVRSDGSIGGFSRGTKAKARTLEREVVRIGPSTPPGPARQGGEKKPLRVNPEQAPVFRLECVEGLTGLRYIDIMPYRRCEVC